MLGSESGTAYAVVEFWFGKFSDAGVINHIGRRYGVAIGPKHDFDWFATLGVANSVGNSALVGIARRKYTVRHPHSPSPRTTSSR